MSHIAFSLPHTRTVDDAKKRIGWLAQDLGESLMIEHRWEGDALRLTRQGADGTITVLDGAVAVDLELSGMLAMMAGQVESQLREMLEAGLK